MLQQDNKFTVNYLTDVFFQISKRFELTQRFVSFLEKRILQESPAHWMFFGCELEFYLLTFKNSVPEEIISELRNSECKDIIFEIKKEIGEHQFEVIPTLSTSALDMCNKVLKIKTTIQEIAKSKFAFCYLDAKPFLDRPPSSMQISMSFYDKSEENLLNKSRNFSRAIIYSLLNDISASSLFTNPTTRCYKRLQNLDDINRYRNIPSYVSWGMHANRTTAIRLANIPDKKERRLEYRVPSAFADVYYVAISILTSILYGVENITKCSFNCPEPIAENVFEIECVKKNRLRRIPSSLKKADDDFTYSEFRKILNGFVKDFVYECDVDLSEMMTADLDLGLENGTDEYE